MDRVYHVGTLDRSHKRRGSLEGAGFSVSLHPAAWRRIARGAIGGTTWSLTREGAVFLDAHRMSKSHLDAVLHWAVDRGHAVESDAWRSRHWNDELEGYVDMAFADIAEAKAERGHAGAGDIRRLHGHRSTPLLEDAGMQTSPALTSRAVIDLVLPIWAHEVHGIDGVWWDDRLDPDRLSAPRGVIHPSAVASWRADPARDPDDGNYER